MSPDSSSPPADLVALAGDDSKWAYINSIWVHYKHAKPAAAKTPRRTIMLFHPFGGNLRSFDLILQPLADSTGYDVVAHDRVGLGLTSRPEPARTKVLEDDPYTVHGAARLAIRLLETLDVRDGIIL